MTLLDVADDVLGERFRPDLKAELRRQLAEHRGRAAALQPAAGGPAEPARASSRTFTVVTQAGAEVTADIWFRCYGVVPVSDYLVGELAAARRPDGFVEVTPFLQVTGQDRVFAVGDVSAADHKMAGSAGPAGPGRRGQHPGADQRGRRPRAARADGPGHHRADRAAWRRWPAGRRDELVGPRPSPSQGPRHDGRAASPNCSESPRRVGRGRPDAAAASSGGSQVAGSSAVPAAMLSAPAQFAPALFAPAPSRARRPRRPRRCARRAGSAARRWLVAAGAVLGLARACHASCSARGLETSLARIAALSVIFIPRMSASQSRTRGQKIAGLQGRGLPGQGGGQRRDRARPGCGGQARPGQRAERGAAQVGGAERTVPAASRRRRQTSARRSPARPRPGLGRAAASAPRSRRTGSSATSMTTSTGHVYRRRVSACGTLTSRTQSPSNSCGRARRRSASRQSSGSSTGRDVGANLGDQVPGEESFQIAA